MHDAGSSYAAAVAVPLQNRLVEFVRLARANDFTVGVAEEIDVHRVGLHCGIFDRDALRWGLRSLLCTAQEDWRRFDELFDAYWLNSNANSRVQTDCTAGRTTRKGDGGATAPSGLPDQTCEGDAGDASGDGPRGGASRRESMYEADFGTLLDPEQMRAMERLVETLARRLRRRLVRRERIQHRGKRLHLRHTIRASLRYGGVPLKLVRKRRQRRQPRLLLVTDVSRSMAMYSFLFLRFSRGIVDVFRDSDAFAFHTRLVHITDALRQPDQMRVSQSLALISRGWSGGTRLGESLAQLNSEYARLLSSRTVLIVISDGLDTGDCGLLTQNLAVLRERCRRLVWLNPLLGRPGYEPRTEAMCAALPHLDLFAPAHNLRSLADLEPLLTDL